MAKKNPERATLDERVGLLAEKVMRIAGQRGSREDYRAVLKSALVSAMRDDACCAFVRSEAYRLRGDAAAKEYGI